MTRRSGFFKTISYKKVVLSTKASFKTERWIIDGVDNRIKSLHFQGIIEMRDFFSFYNLYQIKLNLPLQSVRITKVISEVYPNSYRDGLDHLNI